MNKLLSFCQRLRAWSTSVLTPRQLGHGTFIRGLETTATFDREGQHFILNCPTLSSIKYWPGGLGRTCNYAVVMAQLIIDSKSYGLHAFMCQLRDLETHKPLRGVELGDINAKFGYEMVDNGYLKLDNVRIPRTNMLMRYAQVSPSGEYSRQSIPQTTYLTMVFVRAYIVMGVALDLAKVATIATRYSAVRRQTANKEGVEPQVLDYQTQQMKLFPAISASYAIHFTGMALYDIYMNTMSSVEAGDTVGLAELHALTSTLKAFCSDLMAEEMEVCRRSCGGHGYSHASGIANIYQQSIPTVTFEGENTVLYLQCARSLVKFLGQARKGDKLAPSIQFLSEDPQVSAKLAAAEVLDFDCYLEAARLNALRSLLHEVDGLKVTSRSVAADEAWNRHSVGMVEVAKAFSFHLTVKYFVGAIRERKWELKTREVMECVCEFYAVNGILNLAGSFLQTGVLTQPQLKMLQSRRNKLLTLLRPNSVALVDAFDFPDRILNSCLGRFDGNVYEALYEYAKSSTLNQHQVHPSHMKYVKPLQKLMKARL